MTKREALKLLEISANLTAEALHAGVIGEDEDTVPTESELRDLFESCFDMVHDKFLTLHTDEESRSDLEEKFATIGEMHRIFAQKFAEYDQKLAALHGNTRPSRRPL